jgi:hypothetical protein
VEVASQSGQLFWAHAYYLAADVLEAPTDDRRRQAALAAFAFGLQDLAAFLLPEASAAFSADSLSRTSRS